MMSPSHNRTFIAIDYGSRRIGLAKSDPTGTIASALTTLEVKSPKDALAQLSAVIDEYAPDGLIIGYPVHKSGDKSEKCLEIDRFVEKLSSVFRGPIEKVDERKRSAADVADTKRARQRTDVGQDSAGPF